LKGDIASAVVDATRPDDLRAFFEKIGRFDHLVLTISSQKGLGPFTKLDLADLRQGVDEKVVPYLTATRAALPALRKDGSVTFMSAVTAHTAMPSTVGIGAINSMVETAARVLAAELRPLRVNAVSPSVVDTPWWNFLPEDQRRATFDDFGKKLPVGRVGKPDDIAKAIVFLITNTFMTGQTLVCDGGMSLTN